jgi:hypothetical protein
MSARVRSGITSNASKAGIRVTSANLSTQTSRLVQRKAIPALREENVHKIFGKILREHGELRNIEISIGGPLIVVLR